VTGGSFVSQGTEIAEQNQVVLLETGKGGNSMKAISGSRKKRAVRWLPREDKGTPSERMSSLEKLGDSLNGKHVRGENREGEK